jgi:phage terminase large subunit-like protein
MNIQAPLTTSKAELLSSLTAEQRRKIYQTYTEEELKSFEWDWLGFWSRPSQRPPPGDWLIWLILAGRGFGKTRIGAEMVRTWACGKTPMAKGRFSRMALVAETAADARDVLVEGESGILAVHPPAFRPIYEASKRRLTWPNGAMALLYNATEPDQLRGPQHDAAWCDELAKWARAQETWDMLQFGMRLGERPVQIITTTPRPIKVLKDIIERPGTHVTRGSTLENVLNLPHSFIKAVVDRYQGTRLGRQELNAEILDDNPNALWTRLGIDDLKVDEPEDLKRIVVAVDPSGTKGGDDEKGNDIGIVVVGLGRDGHGYVLADRTCNLSPAGWGRVAVQAYHDHKCDRLVAERNFGGSMVEHVIRTADPSVSYKEVTASRGKWIRAEPVAALYEQGRIHHVGSFPRLEDEMVNFTPDGMVDGESPNRLDALVWAVTELMLHGPVPTITLGGY